MTGKEFDPNSDQPNNPNFPDWYHTLLCPYDLDMCGNEELGENGNEWEGVSVDEFATNQNAQYLTQPCKVDKPDPPGATQTWAEQCTYIPTETRRRTMSCGMCGHLNRQLGKPPFTITPPPVNDPGNEHLYTANMDFHPFGAWLANDAGWDVDETVGLAYRCHAHPHLPTYATEPTHLCSFRSASSTRLRSVTERRCMDTFGKV
jgi:hypothetical protein